MHGTLRAEVAGATEIQGQPCHHGDKNVPLCVFGAVARAIWRKNAAKSIARIADSDVRTAKRWLKGEYPAPGIVIAAIINEITRRG